MSACKKLLHWQITYLSGGSVFLKFMTCLLSHLICTLIAYIANSMKPDQTALKGAV